MAWAGCEIVKWSVQIVFIHQKLDLMSQLYKCEMYDEEAGIVLCMSCAYDGELA